MAPSIFFRKGACMDSDKVRFTTIDGYIALFPAETQKELQQVRATIQAAAPDAQEKISYQMPAFAQKGILVYFAARKDYLGFYPTSSGISAFKQELSGYESSKGAVRFPLDRPIPLDWSTKIVKFRLAENLKKAEDKSNLKKRKK
jgi:uncharacterized protein YdhG (YjbR/CyaY superfamily)